MKEDGVEGLYGGLNMGKLMFGENLISHPAQIFLQKQGEHKGRHLTLACALLLHEEESIFSAEAERLGLTHELILGECMIRPYEKYAGNYHRGRGVASMLKYGGFHHSTYDVQTFPLESVGPNPKRR